MKQWSFGILKLKPDEFWNLTLIEIVEMIEAYSFAEERRDDIESQRISWAVSHIMNASGGYSKAIKPDDLYTPLAERNKKKKKTSGVVERFDSPEQKEEYLKDLMGRFGK